SVKWARGERGRGMSMRQIGPRRIALLAGELVGLCGCASGTRPPAAPALPSACGEAVPGQEQLTAPLVLVGDIHGTTEIPAAFGRLVCHAAEGHRGRPGRGALG